MLRARDECGDVRQRSRRVIGTVCRRGACRHTSARDVDGKKGIAINDEQMKFGGGGGGRGGGGAHDFTRL